MADAGVVRPLLDRFTADVSGVVPLVALWAHGSLALGDFQPGRSDLDLVALTRTTLTREQEQDLERMHETLHSQERLADKLHCVYVDRAELDDAGHRHPTWAHGELFERTVSPVTRRELCQGGLCLLGPAPATMVPPVSDQELADYIRGDLRDFWYPSTARADLWLRDIWVDLGLLTFARATVTLREGRLITKREALEVLTSLDAPSDIVRDIYQRRYESAAPMSETWRVMRGYRARTYLREGIGQALALARGAPCIRHMAQVGEPGQAGGHGLAQHEIVNLELDRKRSRAFHEDLEGHGEPGARAGSETVTLQVPSRWEEAARSPLL